MTLLRAAPIAIAAPRLKFLTCGSVDDGKSTLVGRLLYEKGVIADDHLAALRRDSRRHHRYEGEFDLSLLMDGLEAEREQAITIDVAHRYFATERRSFTVADTPGHEQYTRNMATGASDSDAAVLLVDARKGLVAQTFRHATIASLMGIRHIILAVNKMDLIEFDPNVFEVIAAAFAGLSKNLSFFTTIAIPISAKLGDNVTSSSDRMRWYDGPTLLGYLEALDVEENYLGKPFRMPVQLVLRPSSDFRGFSGTVAGGTVRVGDAVVAMPSARLSHVVRILGPDGDEPSASWGDSITLVLSDDIDLGRGDVLSSPGDTPIVDDGFSANLIWMTDDELTPGRSYLMKAGTLTVPATVTRIRHRLDVTNLSPEPANELRLNEVGVCDIQTGIRFAFDLFAKNHVTGGFILIDRDTNATVAAGMIIETAGGNQTGRHSFSISKAHRGALKRQRPMVIWLTGLSGAGKSTLANLVEARLHAQGLHTMILDGDNLRHGLSRDLGFSEADRLENLRRVGEVAKLMVEAGLIVICAFISPFRAQRRMLRELLEPGEFLEVFVDTPLETCIARDVKGLYRRALSGELRNFTGVDQPYERPERPELIVGRDNGSAQDSADQVLTMLRERRIVDAF